MFPAVVLAAVDGLRELEGGMGEVDGKAGRSGTTPSRGALMGA